MFSLGELDKQMEKAVKFGVDECFVCGRKLSVQDAEQRREDLNEEKVAFDKDKRKADVRLDEIEEELERLEEERLRVKSEFEKSLKDVEGEERELNSQLKDAQKRISLNKKTVPDLEKKLDKLREGVDQRQLDAYIKSLELEESAKTSKSRIGELTAEIKRYANVRNTIEEQKKLDLFLRAAQGHFQRRASEIRDAAKDTFNKRIMEVYGRLEYKDFKNIEINDRYIIEVTRREDGREFRQPINSLSTSERLTIGVITMLAGKQQYLPEFPFFTLDEVITSYDPTKFERIIEYLKGQVDYLIVTRLKGSGELQVKQQLVATVTK